MNYNKNKIRLVAN